MTLNRKTSGEALDYVLKCDAWADGLEEGYGEPSWIPIQILDHAINRTARFDPHNRKIIRDQHLRYKVEMDDGSPLWIQADTIRVTSPRMVMQYAIDRNLFNHPMFSWLKQHFALDGKKIKALHIFLQLKHEVIRSLSLE